MKNTVKLFALIVITAMLFFACDSGETTTPPNTDTEYSALELVADITVGWNLGNTLDAHISSVIQNDTRTVDQMETSWVNTKTSQATIDALKNGGFNAIRFPVSWAKATNSDYVIRADWMARVKEIVDYAVTADMYILLNTHHDEGIFKFMDSNVDESLKAFQKIWEQIADTFKDYNYKLVFEGLNEPRTKNSSAEWSGGTEEEHANLNKYYQVFVDTVRASGGNNGKRVLMINTYAASGTERAMKGLELPTDTVAGKLIVSYHSYTPNNFALTTGGGAVSTWSASSTSDTYAITSHIDRYYNYFVSEGIPVVIGEMGAMNRNNIEARSAWAEYYVGHARSKGMPCFWWDNGVTEGSGELFGLLDRKTSTFIYPEIVAALMKGAGN